MNIATAEIAAVFATAGAVGGSFTATAVMRRLRHQQVTAGRSSCDHCGAALSYAATLPLVSYVLHRGACRTCAGPIDPFHPAGEATGALIGLGAGVASGAVGPAQAVGLVVLGFALLALSLVDLRIQRIPDALTGVVLLAAVLMAARGGLAHLAANLAWALATFGLLSLLRRLFAGLRGQDGLGFGDVKLLSALAVWLGPLTSYALVAACVIALVARLASGRLGGRAAFGPWIALGAWTVGLAAEVAPWPV